MEVKVEVQMEDLVVEVPGFMVIGISQQEEEEVILAEQVRFIITSTAHSMLRVVVVHLILAEPLLL